MGFTPTDEQQQKLSFHIDEIEKISGHQCLLLLVKDGKIRGSGGYFYPEDIEKLFREFIHAKEKGTLSYAAKMDD